MMFLYDSLFFVMNVFGCVLCGRLKCNLFHTQVANLFIHILFYRQIVKDELAVLPQRTTAKTTGDPRIKYSCCYGVVVYF